MSSTILDIIANYTRERIEEKINRMVKISEHKRNFAKGFRR